MGQMRLLCPSPLPPSCSVEFRRECLRVCCISGGWGVFPAPLCTAVCYFSYFAEKSSKGITSLPESDNSSGKSSFVQNDQDLNAGGEKSDPEEEDDGDDDFSSTQQPEDDFLLTQQPAAPILPAARCIEFNCVSDETQSFKVSTASFGESGERIGRTLGTGTKIKLISRLSTKRGFLRRSFPS